MEAPFGYRKRLQRRENCPGGASSNFQTDKGKPPEKQESKEECQEVRIYGEDGGGQQRGKSSMARKTSSRSVTAL